MYSKLKFDADVLVEIESEYTDIYYHYMKEKKLLDFVEQFVKPMEEPGIVLDYKRRRPKTILVTRIDPVNLGSILREIGGTLNPVRRRKRK